MSRSYVDFWLMVAVVMILVIEVETMATMNQTNF